MQHADRVAQTIDVGSAATRIVLGAVVPKYLSFWYGTYGEPCVYLIESGDDWEIGMGYVDPVNVDPEDAPEFVRSTVFQSTNSDAKIDVAVGAKISVVNPAAAAISIMPDVDFPTALFGGVCSGGGSMSAGIGASATGIRAMAYGSFADANGDGSTAFGPKTKARIKGAFTLSDGKSVAQRGHSHEWTGSGSSADATAGTIANNTGDYAPSANSAQLLQIQVVGRRTAPSSAAYAATINTLLTCSVGGVAAFVGTPAKTDIAVTGGVTASCAVAIVSNAVQVTGQGGASGETWEWAATIRATEQREVA